MNGAEAQKLAQQIPIDLPSVRVDGLRRYGDFDYAVNCTETRNGISFVVYGHEDWTDRVNTARFYGHN